MLPKSGANNVSSGRLASARTGAQGATAISGRSHLLTDSWTADVQRLEWAIRGFPDVVNNCDVALFEIDADEHLHCNVTHRHATKTATGWSGPGHVADGFVHNRRFGDTPHNDMVRHIRDMVFAARV